MIQNQEKKDLRSFLGMIPERTTGIGCIGLTGSERAYFIYSAFKSTGLPVFVTVSSTKEAEKLQEDLNFFFGEEDSPVCYFPPYNILPYKSLSYHNETAAHRINTLYRLTADSNPQVLITTVSALLQTIIPKSMIITYPELIIENEEVDREALISKMVSVGYSRTVIAEEPGDFCVRGGILDVFSPLYDDPVRIEFYGDLIESIRFYAADTQRTKRNISEVIIPPAREVILEMDHLDEFINRVRILSAELEMATTKTRTLVERIKKEGIFPGIENLIPLIYTERETLMDYLPENSLPVLMEPDSLAAAADRLLEQAEGNYQTAKEEGRFCVSPDQHYLEWTEVEKQLSTQNPLSVSVIPVLKSTAPDKIPAAQVILSVEDNSGIIADLKASHDQEHILKPLVQWVGDKQNNGFTVLLAGSSMKRAERLKSLLVPYGIDIKFIERLDEIKKGEKRLYTVIGSLTTGFVWPDEQLAVITANEILGPKRGKRKKDSPKVHTELLSLGDLKQDDLVVHNDHGISRYGGLTKLSLNGITNDFLLLYFKDEDKLYLPVDRMGVIQKYLGVDSINPVLDKMGGKTWDKVRAKVKKSVEAMAGELLKLYSDRKVHKGHSFGRVDTYFREFESGFPYEETADQLKAIEDVLEDMASDKPMDRLVCGDVGYGKTEVALRASFLAVNAGKQVAILVPTTVLAEQHYATFSERYERYPVNIACLSRFRSTKDQREIVDRLRNGKIDIVIGTHRLIQKDISFKDIGLLILDEEQRFGVRHKEKLKRLRTSVDVLALTATPIPRTLHMSLLGIRDISVISTPPEQRHSIITYISEFDDSVIADAVRNELERKGQIYFIHNNVHSIWKIAQYIQDLVPEARIDVGHGQMSEDALEKVMQRFVDKDIDLLVCTTIIESGIDIPSANTILVNRADRFGLSQIYQLRGRVGRSEEQAYAYLFIPGESTLSKDAQKRLKVLMEHSDLGAGFQIAMSDLKIRGGGSILGASQSGHIAAVGYDMFLKLMETSVAELKGEPVVEDLDPEINIPMSAYIPESYIPDIDQRLSTYRRLSRMTSLDDIAECKAEMVDRFGEMPPEAANVLKKIMLKIMSVRAGVRRLDLTENLIVLYFSEAHQRQPHGIVDLIVSDKNRFTFTPDHVLKVKITGNGGARPLSETKNILKEISQRVNA
ncbi:MAG: transcription-repair coupling factor [Desulfobacterales bacterium]|nr:transcription-repair coupling factor [Desulfobacterales bacterium]